MELKAWLCQERGRGQALALYLKEHQPTVSDWGSGKRAIPVGRGAPIEAFTDGAVTRQEMFPERWQEYWPELAQVLANHSNPAIKTEAIRVPHG